MIHVAHASYYHWSVCGTEANQARGEWQVARVYCELGQAESARYHAARCLELVTAGGEGFEDWDLPAAHEVCARAELIAGDEAAAGLHAGEARRLLALVGDAEDRELVADELTSLGL